MAYKYGNNPLYKKIVEALSDHFYVLKYENYFTINRNSVCYMSISEHTLNEQWLCDKIKDDKIFTSTLMLRHPNTKYNFELLFSLLDPVVRNNKIDNILISFDEKVYKKE